MCLETFFSAIFYDFISENNVESNPNVLMIVTDDINFRLHIFGSSALTFRLMDIMDFKSWKRFAQQQYKSECMRN